MVYDLIIIGAGPAGITASVYAARKRMNFLVITQNVGGQTILSSDVENYTGYQFITGPELAGKFQEHMKGYNVELKEGESVVALAKKDDIIEVKTDKGLYKSKTAIVASGKVSKELNVPGEKEFKNRGVTYCATCDGPLFTDKDVAVIGGGNSALDAATQMGKIARHTYIINAALNLTGDPIIQGNIRRNKNISVKNNARVEAIFGDKFVSGIMVNNSGKKEKLSVQGVFVEIGLIPNSTFANSLEKNEKDEIKVSPDNEASLPGVFAAGDVTDVPEKQIIVAAGEGAKAALSVFRYLTRNESYRESY